ncbi:hypothetical protein CUZ56_01356 [Saezia sanguinis]|uniref:Integrating conjugative element protein n=1 Tax=Saezia sanguinis TaxID=1965230 RepID=A0A433SF88_9BURK|nr:TIGR03749 family integrating conjugative element protein [Saezia sanguinis]RUS67411.1 hypothetical protein CUZ56_01356 [Saezia sanguinis]
MKTFKLSLLIALTLMFSQVSSAVELMRWERIPLAVPLLVGQERIVFVDRNVRIGVPMSIQNKLRIQTAHGTVYLKAEAPIPPTRIQLQDAQTGELILIDIAAAEPKEQQPELEPVRIIEGEVTAKHYSNTASTQPNTSNALSKPALPRETPIPIILTRYAAQNLYAPLRTVEPVQGISRANLRQNMDLSTLLPQLPIRAKPLATWRLEDYFVTALRLQNASKEIIQLDPRLLQGNFTAATFQHSVLGPFGQPEDTTVLYLITRKRGLHESLLPNISQFNAQINLQESRYEK